MQPAAKSPRFVTLPENRAAWLATHEVLDAFHANRERRLPNPLVLHGPSGAGKTHLATSLVRELVHRDPTLSVQHIAADDWKTLTPVLSKPKHFQNPGLLPAPTDDAEDEPAWLVDARRCDFLVIEDLQHLPARSAEAMTQLLDGRMTCRQPTLVTANLGPRQLAARRPRLPARLASRLAGGLVVAMESLASSSRRQLLEEFAQRRQLPVAPDILEWLATHLTGGGRQLEGAIAQLDTLSRLQKRSLSLADIRPHFRAQVDALRPSVQRILQQVSGLFHVTPEELTSRRRLRAILVPRQVTMYLARRLTKLSLKQIGACLGGHDHTTVMHACHKIETALKHDALLCGAVRQLTAELA